MLDEIIPNIIDDLDNGILEVMTPADLCEMLRTVGVNIRHISKISTQAKEQHIKELAIIEILSKKISNVAINRLDYIENIDPNATGKYFLVYDLFAITL